MAYIGWGVCIAMQGCQVFECYHTATTTVCHHRLTNSMVYTYAITCMACTL